MQINDFLKSTLKVATSIFLAGIALFIVGWIVLKVNDTWTKHEAKQYEAIKNWSIDLKKSLQIDLRARTKLVDGRLLAEINIDGYPAYLSDPRLEARNRAADITLLFQDKDGFKVHSKAIQVSEFTTVIDTRGNTIGLRYEYDEHMNPETYGQFSQLSVQWTLNTVLPVSTNPASPSVRKIADHCAPNLSKAERLKRLAQHGPVRQTGDNSYSVGYRSLDFYSDGSLMNCQ